MKHIHLFTLAALLAAPLGASAQTVIHAPIEAFADTFVDQASPTNSNGNATNIDVRGTNGSNANRYIYLQFNLSAITGPITAAELTLTGQATNTKRTTSTISLFGLAYATMQEALTLGSDDSGLEDATFTNETAPWPAVKISDFSAPANATGVLSTAAVPDSDSFAAGTPVIFESTSALVSFLESARTGSGGIVTFVIIELGQQSNPVKFAAQDHAARPAPALTITTTPIPEPTTTAALAALAALCAILVIRRRR
ncbi:MAG: DNRLRE domain-containing protein [Opitutaceae bacterium]|jgi:hypothetical protein|nr:DNRLRE domain-containing protein [Opitutaceae bacterium]